MDRGAWKVIVNGVTKSRTQLTTMQTIFLTDLGQRVNLFVRIQKDWSIWAMAIILNQARFLPSPTSQVTFGKTLIFISGGRCY